MKIIDVGTVIDILDPQGIGRIRYFSFDDNRVYTLDHCPEYVGGALYCRRNYLTDFRGFPEFYEGEAFFGGNPVFEVIKDVRGKGTIPTSKFIYLLNEYSVIRPGMKIIRDRLDAAYDGIGEVMPENIEIEGYEII
jgi:hypothetical protein